MRLLTIESPYKRIFTYVGGAGKTVIERGAESLQIIVGYIVSSGGTDVGSASETSQGILEIATQAETDAGTDDVKAVTPMKLANFGGRLKKALTRNLKLNDNPQVHKLFSPWKKKTVSSSGYSSTGTIFAIPIDCGGLDIVGFGCVVQGAIVGLPQMACAVYNSDAEGLPSVLLGEAQSPAFTTAGNKEWNLASPILAADHSDRVWLAFVWQYIAGASYQLVVQSNTGLFHQDFPTIAGTSINLSIDAGELLQFPSTYAGTNFPNPYNQFGGSYGLNISATGPSIVLLVREP